MAQGKSNKEIGSMLFISSGTVKSHVKSIFANEPVRGSTTSIPKGADWSTAHDGRDRVVVFLHKINQVAKTNEKDSFFSSACRVTWMPANRDVNATNKSDQTKYLMILEFKDTAVEEA